VNTTLTGLGIALVLALAAALLAPWFIDWNAYRPVFEARAAAALGVPVRIAGPISVTLLPTPHLRLADVRAGRAADQRLAVKALSFDLAIMPLLSGRFEVTDLAIDSPTVVATIDGNGRPLLPVDAAAVGGARLGAISLADVAVTNGTVELVDGLTGQRRRLTAVALTGSATSLAGPMKLAGSAVFDGARYDFRLGTGTFQGSRGGLHLMVKPPGAAPTLDVDGTLAGDHGQPIFTGRATLKPPIGAHAGPAAELPWQFTGRVTATARRIVADQLDLQFGAAARALHLAGSAEIDLGPQRGIDLALHARQLDLDRARGVTAAAPAEPPLRILAAIAAALPMPPRPGWPLTATVSVGSVVLGGDLMQNAALSLGADQQGWAIHSFSVDLPGHTHFGLGGRASPGDGGPRFAGAATLDTQALPDFLRWLGAKADSRSAAPVRSLSLTGRVTAASGRFALDSLRITAGGATLTGRAAWQAGASAPRLDLVLAADRLDVDRLGLPQLAAALGGKRDDPFAGADFDLKLAAKRLDWAGVAATGVNLDLSRRGDALDVRSLTLTDLGGAALDAHGKLSLADGHPSGEFTARVDAASLGGIVAALRETPAPRGIADALAGRATALAPMHLALTLATAAKAGALTAHLGGTLGKTEVSADGRIERLALDAPISATLAASSPDAAAFLAQLGLPAAPLGDAGAAALRLALSGTPSRGADLDGSATVAGTAFSFDGRLRAPRAEVAVASGRLSAAGEDLAPLIVLLGRAPPAALPALPLRLQADARIDRHGIALEGLSGAVAGRALGGTLAWSGGTLSGALKVPHLALADLVGMAVGPLALEGGAVPTAWPDGPLAPGILAGLSGSVALTCGDLVLLPGAALHDASLDLVLAPGDTRLENVRGALAGGTFAGEFRLRRVGGQAALSLRAKLDRGDLGTLAWRVDGRPAATGTLSFNGDAQGTGTTLAAIAGNLAGSGSVSVAGTRIGGLDPGAFARIATAMHDIDRIEPARVGSLAAAELPKGDLDAGTLTSAFTIASGTLRADIAAASPTASLAGHASLALARLALSADLTLAPKHAPEGGEAPPSIALRFDGPLQAPRRTLDVTPLTGYLTMRAVEREVKEVDALEAERRRQEAAQAAAAKAEAARRAAIAAQQEAARKAEADKAAAAAAAAQEKTDATTQTTVTPALAPADLTPLPPLPPPRAVGPAPGASAPVSGVTVGAPRTNQPPALGAGGRPHIIAMPPPAPPEADDPIDWLLQRQR
jgi:uncharacterized protein involved in outer membrane biogenesis